MMFEGSENVPEAYFHTEIPEWGGNSNGQITKDHTIYFQIIPKNALEKNIWMESDRMGFLINTVTNESLEKEKTGVDERNEINLLQTMSAFDLPLDYIERQQQICKT